MEKKKQTSDDPGFKTGDSVDMHDIIARKVDKFTINTFRNLDKENPLENEKMFNVVKKHMPKPGYMEVTAHEEHDPETGEIFVVSESEHKNDKGETKTKRIRHDPFFRVDLNTAIAANIAQAPMNIVPMIIDKAQDIVWEEKKAFRLS